MLMLKLKCKECPATCWVRGHEEADVNLVEVDDSETPEWESDPPNACKHEDYDIVDQDYDSSDSEFHADWTEPHHYGKEH